MLKSIVLPCGYGQTCNQLLQIVHWMPLSIEFDIPLYFPGFRRYANMFQGTSNQKFNCFPRSAPNINISQSALSRLCSYMLYINYLDNRIIFNLARKIPSVITVCVDEEDCTSYSIDQKEIMDYVFNSTKHTLWVKGWLYRDNKGVSKHMNCIKEFFSPVKNIQESVSSCVDKRKNEKTVIVGVHIRRGDYRKWANGKYYYDDKTFYDIMKSMVKLIPNKQIKFLMVSNEFVDISNYNGLDTFKGPSDAGGDLFSLAACDYIIGPPSTFTIWASFFGNVPLYTIKNTINPISIDSFIISSG